MSKAAFPINDLLRRPLQTGLTIATLALSVASTLFLLLFSGRLGIGFTSATGVLTLGLTAIFSQFMFFVGILIFAVGAVLTSFIAFFMMAQRTRDFGLIKAAGCPNSLVAGYFTTELLTTTFAGCVLGILLGVLIDFGVANTVFSGYHLPNLMYIPAVFVVFFVLALIFGLWPILKASKMSPIKALSPVNYYNLISRSKHKSLSKSKLTWNIAVRSMLRRQSGTFRIFMLLSIVFILLTLSVAGGIIANATTTAWVQNTVSKNTIAVATNSMGTQYEQLLSTFSGGKAKANFNYSDQNLAVPQTIINQLKTLSTVSSVNSRLVLIETVQEVANYSFGVTSADTITVGGSRQGESIVMGVDPSNPSGTWHGEGQFLSTHDDFDAVVGDSIAQTMYTADPSQGINQSDPLVEGISIGNTTFNIVGTCVDPTNNGYITYVPIQTLQNNTGLSSPNLLLVTLKNSGDQSAVIAQIKTLVQSVNPNLNVFSLNSVVDKNTNFLASTWQTIMIVPLFTLVSAALCMISYMMIAVEEQRQEFAVLRAVGAKPKFVVSVLAIQSIIVLLSSFGVGISFGTIVTLLILLPQPIITGFTILEIAGILFAALLGILIFSLYPAVKLAKSSILKIIT